MGCLTRSQGTGEEDAEWIALALNCVLSLSESSTSRKWPLEHERKREWHQPSQGGLTQGTSKAGQQQQSEKNPIQMNLAIQEFAGTKSRKKLFYFITYVGFELHALNYFYSELYFPLLPAGALGEVNPVL